jgi:hypothetical protein
MTSGGEKPSTRRDRKLLPLPVQCIFEKDRRLFRVTRNRGKDLAMGGFGILVETAEDAKISEDPPVPPVEYLFIEEVLFLHERGFLEVLLSEEEEGLAKQPLDSYQLYHLLEPCGLSLAAHLVYAHLRAQDFRVIRHTPYRRQILEDLQECAYERQRRKEEIAREKQLLEEQGIPAAQEEERLQDEESPSHEGVACIDYKKEPGNSISAWKLKLRQDAAHACPPTVFSNDNGQPASIAFHVYNPKSGFSRSDPGLPDLYVAATFYCDSCLKFQHLQELLQLANGIPLRMATVSDAGTVVMFGVTDFGVPERTTEELRRKEPEQSLPESSSTGDVKSQSSATNE